MLIRACCSGWGWFGTWSINPDKNINGLSLRLLPELTNFALNMKRFVAILLALIYITTTSGIVISTHYCMGEVSGIALGQSQAESCATCGMDNEGCCHDDLDVIKLTDNHQYSQVSSEIPSFEAAVVSHRDADQRSIALTGKCSSTNNHSPPLTFSRNTLFCVYRI